MLPALCNLRVFGHNIYIYVIFQSLLSGASVVRRRRKKKKRLLWMLLQQVLCGLHVPLMISRSRAFTTAVQRKLQQRWVLSFHITFCIYYAAACYTMLSYSHLQCFVSLFWVWAGSVFINCARLCVQEFYAPYPYVKIKVLICLILSELIHSLCCMIRN